MKSLSSIGLVLSVIFGCLFLALIAEVYYLLWWKKRITKRSIENGYSSPKRVFLYMFCLRKSSSLSSTALNPQGRVFSSENQVQEPHLVDSDMDFWLKPYGENSMESELMRLQNFSGPPRLLFTIKEETKEDLESEDGKSKADRSRKNSRNRSLSDLFHTAETPYLTPLASPSYFTPPMTPIDLLSSHKHHQHHHGFNPFFESASDAEFNKIIRSSPPPAFKFLRDAEDKLYKRKLIEEAERVAHQRSDDSTQVGNAIKSPSSRLLRDEGNGSFITLIFPKNKDLELDQQHHQLPQYPSCSSQVLPLASSPQSLRLPSNTKSPLHQKLQQ